MIGEELTNLERLRPVALYHVPNEGGRPFTYQPTLSCATIGNTQSYRIRIGVAPVVHLVRSRTWGGGAGRGAGCLLDNGPWFILGSRSSAGVRALHKRLIRLLDAHSRCVRGKPTGPRSTSAYCPACVPS